MTVSLPETLRATVRDRLAAWYRKSHRDLPWRKTRDPYRIWLSETMLQQTRVDTVVPYYERFLERFPDLETLAVADEEDVLREWAGLGYYARARNLKRAAETIVRDHDGRIPCDAEALAALPGVGPYTVGALRSIAYRQPAAIVDGNVARVLSRLLGEADLSRRELWQIAEELVPARRPDQFNQALMELGATICLPRSPHCARCPVRQSCAAASVGTPEAYPAPAKKPLPKPVEAISGLFLRGRQHPALLMLRRPSKGLLGGLWEIPSVEGNRTAPLLASVRERTGLRTRAGRTLGVVQHIFTHRALTLRIVRLHPHSAAPRTARRSAEQADMRWCTRDELQNLPLSKLMRKALSAANVEIE